MSAVTTEEREPVGLLRAWWRTDRQGMIRTIALGLSLLSFLALWPSLIQVGGARNVILNLFLHAFVLGWLLLATVTVRTVGFRDVVVAFLVGVFTVTAFVFVTGWPALQALGPRSSTLAVYWASILEELGMLVGVLLLAWRHARRARLTGRSLGVADLTVLGFAVGGGYAVHEDALWGRVLASWTNWPDHTVAGAFEGPYAWLFPTFTYHPTSLAGGPSFSTYHAGSGAFLGLLVGIAIVYRYRRPWTIWLVPAGLLYAIVDHGLGNYMIHAGPSPLRHLFLNGHVMALVVLVGLVVAVLVEELRRRQADLAAPPAVGLEQFRYLARHGHGQLDIFARWLAMARYHRTRNAFIVGRWRLPDPPALDPARIDVWDRIAHRGLRSPVP